MEDIALMIKKYVWQSVDSQSDYKYIKTLTNSIFYGS